MKDTLHVRFRVDFGQFCSIGPGKIQLLKAIDDNGSLSKAARATGMSYRRAWMLMDSMNNSFTKPVVSTSLGGSGGGGAIITEFGHQLMKSYCHLENKFALIVKRNMRDIERHVQLSRTKKSKPATKSHRSLSKSGRTR